MLKERYSRSFLEKVPVPSKPKNPAVYVIGAYFALIILGTLLLSLPIAQEKPVALIDNIFISASAVCVTGLASIDIGSMYSHFGHWVIILLMQAGGLGVMTFSTTIILFAGMRPSFKYISVFTEEFSHHDFVPLQVVLKAVVPFTLVMEGIGFFTFLWQFNETNLYDRAFSALFHTISLFCNVGLSLYPDSLMQFGHNPLVVLVSCALVITGGFGFIASMELPNLFKKRVKVSLHTKLALIFTSVLLVAITAGFLIMEYSNALVADSLPQKILNSFAYSTMSRTAGINFSEISTITSGTLMMTLIAMFIGANPGSCGGGIKTTTFAVVVILAINRLRGKSKVHVLGKTIPQDIVNKAVYLFIISAVIITFSTFILLLTETESVPYATVASDDISKGHYLHFAQIVFESISAFATCGLSLGATPDLSIAGKLVVSFIMFVGRMGPMFLISTVVQKTDDQVWESEENVMIG